MALEISGKLVKLLPETTGQGKNGNWIKQEFVIETTDQFPKKVMFAAWGDKVDLIRNLSEGQELKVSFNVESREYNNRWYTDLKVWKIDKGGAAVTGSSNNNYDRPKNNFGDQASVAQEIPPMPPQHDDLPF